MRANILTVLTAGAVFVTASAHAANTPPACPLPAAKAPVAAANAPVPAIEDARDTIDTSAAAAVAAPVSALPAPVQVSQVAETSNETPSVPYRPWELGLTASQSFSGTNSLQVNSGRLTARRFLTDSLAIGAEGHFWGNGAYALADDAGSGSFGAGVNGQLYFFRSSILGGYVGSSLLWVPMAAQVLFAPEAGIKWFAHPRLAVGATYWILTDLSTYTTSFAPPSTGRSRQALGIEISVYL